MDARRVMEQANPATAHQKRQLVFLGLGFLVLAAATVQLGLFKQISLDDPYITFRYAKNLVAGEGLRWNPGEAPVEGYSNFTWALLSAAAIRWGLDPMTFAKALGAISLAGLLALFFSPLNRVTRSSSGALFGSALVALAPAVCFYAVSGMETLFFTLLGFGGCLCFVRSLGEERRRVFSVAAGLLWGVAAITRPEGLGLFGIGLLFLLAHRRFRDLPPLVIPFAAIWGTHLLWRLGYYGSPLPNTFFAKYTGGGLGDSLQGLRYFGEGLRTYLSVPIAAILVSGVLVRASSRHKEWRLDLQFLGFFVVAYFGYVALIGGDDVSAFPSSRLFVPGLPALYLLLAASLERGDGEANPWLALPIAMLCVACAIPDAYGLAKESNSFNARSTLGEMTRRVLAFDSDEQAEPELARWIRRTTPPTALIAVPMAGKVPYFVDRRFIDTFGLNDKHIARTRKLQRGLDVKIDPEYVLSRKPDLVVINVRRDAAKGLITFEQGGGWKLGDRMLMELLQSSPQYALDEGAPTAVAVFRRKPQ